MVETSQAKHRAKETHGLYTLVRNVNSAVKGDRQAERLRRLRERGRWRYILWHGVVGYGLTVAILFTVVDVWLEGEALADVLPKAIIVFALGGYFFGECMWYVLSQDFPRDSRRHKKPLE